MSVFVTSVTLLPFLLGKRALARVDPSSNQLHKCCKTFYSFEFRHFAKPVNLSQASWIWAENWALFQNFLFKVLKPVSFLSRCRTTSSSIISSFSSKQLGASDSGFSASTLLETKSAGKFENRITEFLSPSSDLNLVKIFFSLISKNSFKRFTTFF